MGGGFETAFNTTNDVSLNITAVNLTVLYLSKIILTSSVTALLDM